MQAMSIKTKRTVKGIAKESIAWILALIVIVPFLIVILNALKTSGEALGMSLKLPKKINWSNFSTVWNVGNIPRAFMNSLILTMSTVIMSIIVAAPCAYVLSRKRTGANKAIYAYFVLGLMVPVNMVCIVKLLKVLNLYNTYIGAILIFTALILPLSVFLFFNFIASVPKDLDEAAIVDGAGAYITFFSIILPLLKPVTVTVIMINFLNVWNDFTIPLYILPDVKKTVIVQQVYNFYGQLSADWNLVCTAILYAVAPILIVYIIGQKYIISGMTAGAVKG